MRIQLVFAMLAGSAMTVSAADLVDAAAKGDKAAVQQMLKQHTDVNAASPDGTTALHWAAQLGDAETAGLLIRAGANVKATNRYGVTPLAEACANGNGDVAALLLKAGADANAVTGEGETALMTASRAGNAGAVKALLAAGADVNAKENYRGQTAVMWAAVEGHADVIRLLTAKGADLNVHSVSRDTTAPKLGGGTPIVPIARGGMTALLFAARQGHVEAVQALLEAGVDINQTDPDGVTALILAVMNSHYDLAGFLLDKGANPNLADKNGRTALYAAADMHSQEVSVRPARKEFDKLSSLDVIEAALAHGANPNPRLKNKVGVKAALDQGDPTLAAGTTPFIRAARGADLPLMRLLMDKGADPKLTLDDKTSALMIAAGIGYREGRTRGSDSEAIEAIKLCMDRGLDINAVSDKGDTALHGAALRGSNEIVQFLVDHGAKLDAKNKQGFSPLDIALGKGGQGAGGVRNPHDATAALIQKLLRNNTTAMNTVQ